MNRLRAWWGPLEPVQRAGFVAFFLILGFVALAVLEPEIVADFMESMTLR